MTIFALASDHAGVELKALLSEALKLRDVEVIDLGPDGSQSVDYPDYGYKLAEAVVAGRADRGIGICGSGIGISIALNRHPGIRAALCHDHLSVTLARRHNDANVLVLGARLIGVDVARDCLTAFIETSYEGGRHDRRVAKLGAPRLAGDKAET